MQVAALAQRRVPSDKQHVVLGGMRALVSQHVTDRGRRDAMLQVLGRGSPPMCFPVGLDSTNLRRLPRRPLVGLKADGDRAALLLFTLPNGSGAAALVDRGGTMSRVGVAAAAPDAFRGTWLDVEVTLDKSARTLLVLVLDAVCVCGRYVGGVPFEERHKAATLTVQLTQLAFPCSGGDGECWQPNRPTMQMVPCTCMLCATHAPSRDYDPSLPGGMLGSCPSCRASLVAPNFAAPLGVELRVKPLFSAADARLAWASRSVLDYEVDGLVVHDADALLPLGRTEDMLKWKPREATTVDLAFTWGQRGLVLQPPRVRMRFVPVPVRDALARDLVTGAVYVGEFGVRDVGRGDVEVTLLRLRRDKSEGNTAATLETTLRNVAHAVTPEHLFTALQQVLGHP